MIMTKIAEGVRSTLALVTGGKSAPALPDEPPRVRDARSRLEISRDVHGNAVADEGTAREELARRQAIAEDAKRKEDEASERFDREGAVEALDAAAVARARREVADKSVAVQLLVVAERAHAVTTAAEAVKRNDADVERETRRAELEPEAAPEILAAEARGTIEDVIEGERRMRRGFGGCRTVLAKHNDLRAELRAVGGDAPSCDDLALIVAFVNHCTDAGTPVFFDLSGDDVNRFRKALTIDRALTLVRSEHDPASAFAGLLAEMIARGFRGADEDWPERLADMRSSSTLSEARAKTERRLREKAAAHLARSEEEAREYWRRHARAHVERTDKRVHNVVREDGTYGEVRNSIRCAACEHNDVWLEPEFAEPIEEATDDETPPSEGSDETEARPGVVPMPDEARLPMSDGPRPMAPAHLGPTTIVGDVPRAMPAPTPIDSARTPMPPFRVPTELGNLTAAGISDEDLRRRWERR